MSINPANITTVRVDQLPPSTPILSDLMCFEKSDQILYQMSFQDLVNFVNLNSNAFQYEIKSLFVDQTYIDNNIDLPTGLGINLLVGWRLFTEIDDKIELGYGAVRSNIGSYVGSNTHTLTESEVPTHTHSIPTLVGRNAASGGSEIVFNAGTSATSKSTSSFGGGQSHSIMQSSLVVLKIVKL